MGSIGFVMRSYWLKGEKKGQQAPYFAKIKAKNGMKSWNVVVQVRGSDGTFREMLNQDFDNLYHAKQGLRAFRDGLDWK